MDTPTLHTLTSPDIILAGLSTIVLLERAYNEIFGKKRDRLLLGHLVDNLDQLVKLNATSQLRDTIVYELIYVLKELPLPKEKRKELEAIFNRPTTKELYSTNKEDSCHH